MAKRLDISATQNRWHDAQRVDKSDMEVEQNHNSQINAAIINNHFGSGVLPTSILQKTLFDSDSLDSTSAGLLAAHNFDGVGISPTAQPSDTTLGNQLEVELTGSSVFGRLSVKVAIIGVGFDDTLQLDRFYFYKNEKQVTSKHYKKILSIIFNDFKGNNNCSRTNGGRIVIRETKSFQISRDPIMVSQDVEPDIFWRDLKKVNTSSSLLGILQDAIGAEYSVDDLDINTTGRPSKTLEANDVTSQVGQKFLAKTDNIQKVTLLLGTTRDDSKPEADIFDWSGDLVISIYPLQTTTVCSTDIVPELAIDFDPANTPLAQLSFNQSTLKDAGYVLTDVLQPVDFVFNNTKLGSGSTSGISIGKYYAVTLKRSGAATSGTILIGCGNNKVEDSRVTLFSGVWVDVSEEDLWFQVWTDALKVADGQGYDNGNGITISKTTIDDETGSNIDNENKGYSFTTTGENLLNVAVLQAVVEESVEIQDERTGNNVFSRKIFSPSFSLLTESEVEDLKSISDPLILGCVQDTNPKQNPTLEKEQTFPGLAKGDSFIVINPDADLLSLNLLGSKLYPNITDSDKEYRIFKVTLCTDGYGDVNGDGTIDTDDVSAASSLLGESLFYTSTQTKINNGEFSTLELIRADVDGDGYVTAADVDLITQYVNRTVNSFPVGSSFTHLELKVQSSTGRYDGYYDCADGLDDKNDGYVRIDGSDGYNLVEASTLSADALIYNGYYPVITLESVSGYSSSPFSTVTYRISPQTYWQDYLLALNSDVRLVPAAFTESSAIVPSECSTALTYSCEDKNDIVPFYDPGRNDVFFPDDLYIGKGELRRPDGNHYKIDYEVGIIVINLPEISFDEVSLNIFEKLVVDRGDGFTTAGYPAMRYADCTTVQAADLSLNRVRIEAGIQSISKNTDGYSEDDGYGVILDELLAIYLNGSTGILTLSVRNLETDQIYKTLSTKIQITVHLKKGGWNNSVLEIDADKVSGLLSN